MRYVRMALGAPLYWLGNMLASIGALIMGQRSTGDFFDKMTFVKDVRDGRAGWFPTE